MGPSKAETMNRAAQIARVQWSIGVGLAVIFSLLSYMGATDWLEYWSRDLRAAFCGAYTPPPHDSIVLVAMNDELLRTEGWPLPREKFARMIEELDDAGAAVIAVDVLFTEAVESEGETLSVGDQRLRDAIASHGGVILAASFPWDEPARENRSDVLGGEVPRVPFEDVFEQVGASPDLPSRQLLRELLAIRSDYPRALRDELGKGAGPALDDFTEKFERAHAILRTRTRSAVASPQDGRPWPDTSDPRPPIPAFTDAAARIASVTYRSEDLDGKVRLIPLWTRHAEYCYPNLGLSAAATYLGADPDKLALSMSIPDERQLVTVTPAYGSIRSLPMGTRDLKNNGPTYALQYITWPRTSRTLDLDDDSLSLFPTRGWREQFKRESMLGPAVPDAALVSGGSLLDPLDAERRIAENLATLDAQVRLMVEAFDVLSADDVVTYEETAEMVGGERVDLRAPGWRALYLDQKTRWERAIEAATEIRQSMRPDLDALFDFTPEEASEVANLEVLIEDMISGFNLLEAATSDDRRFGVELLLRRGERAQELYGAFDNPQAFYDVGADLLAADEGEAWSDVDLEAFLNLGADAFAALSERYDPFAARAPMLMELNKAQVTRVLRLHLFVERAPLAVAEIDAGIERIDELRKKRFRNLFGGKIVFIGWTATGVDADFISTSIDTKTPGVYVHMAVANALLTEHTLRMASRWADVLTVLGAGILATFVAVRFGVAIGPQVLVLLALAGTAISGVFFWDSQNLVTPLGAPLVSGFVSWLAVSMHRLFVEEVGRKRTEERFKSYVSPEVVDILVNNPNLDTMKPTKKEVTVMFSDIAGFTSLTEKLGTEQIAEMLATYLGAMTEELQIHKATIDKYIGDAVMAFWGAPLDDPDHARHAAEACLAQLDRLDLLNSSHAFAKEAGELQIRLGLATGVVNVGDFGNPPNKSAYTVIGDTVNLAARLESGSKQFGTTVTISQRTRDLIGEDILVRPLGRIVVKGKSEPESLFELIGHRTPKGERTLDWIQLTEESVLAYITGKFDDCLAGFDQLEREFGEKALTGIYRSSIEMIRAQGGPGEEFDGAVVLTDK
ncbi:MAG: CHASE2 domain-containing protein [Planctomycetota bacterium]